MESITLKKMSEMLIADRQDGFIFGTKAETLSLLDSVLSFSDVPEFIYFTVEDWKEDRGSLIQKIQDKFSNKRIIVRSSALNEDGNGSSHAGYYASVDNVPAHDEHLVIHAIEVVIQSFLKENSDMSLLHLHQVIVQRMIHDVQLSGVLFTCDLNTGAPYYVINYDDLTGRTDTVTSGGKFGNRTLYVYRNAVDMLRSDRFRNLLHAVAEIEHITGAQTLDIEFAIDLDGRVFVFQVRRIPESAIKGHLPAEDAAKVLEKLYRKVQYELNFAAAPGGSGRTLFGQMPDWNPAELLGSTPGRLAFSLYDYLITNNVWSKARKLMGYSEPDHTCLMVDFAGKPYIDVRKSFQSFIPETVDKSLSCELADIWVEYLIRNKHFHDKIEFNVAITAHTLNFQKRISGEQYDRLGRSKKSHFEEKLLGLTNRLVSGMAAPTEQALSRIALLERNRGECLQHYGMSPIERASMLLKDCQENGTLPFAVIARHAFIACEFLGSLCDSGGISPDEADGLKKSIRSIAGEFVEESRLLSLGEISLEEYLKKYGHLRPGTYDILSPRYDQRKIHAHVFSFSENKGRNIFRKEFARKVLIAKIDEILKGRPYEFDAETLVSYIEKAVAAREYAKFIFTRNISDALELIAEWGKGIGMPREKIAHLDIRDILESENTVGVLADANEYFLASEKNSQLHGISRCIVLPQLIDSPEDVFIAPLLINRPNFITRKRVIGAVKEIERRSSGIEDICDKIVAIEGADPGYDWIFSTKIKGLVTKYGGANSHMAIRCAEFSLPAAIGCGEQIYNRVSGSRMIDLNCAECRIDEVDI